MAKGKPKAPSRIRNAELPTTNYNDFRDVLAESPDEFWRFKPQRLPRSRLQYEPVISLRASDISLISQSVASGQALLPHLRQRWIWFIWINGGHGTSGHLISTMVVMFDTSRLVLCQSMACRVFVKKKSIP